MARKNYATAVATVAGCRNMLRRAQDSAPRTGRLELSPYDRRKLQELKRIYEDTSGQGEMEAIAAAAGLSADDLKWLTTLYSLEQARQLIYHRSGRRA